MKTFKSLFFLLLAVGIIPLFSTQNEATPKQEYDRILTYSINSPTTLSQALRELIVDVGDTYYNAAFFQKLSEAEKIKFNGEYVDHWENGQMKLKATLVQGVVDGHVHGWYPDGMESFKAYFDMGKKTGIHLAFYPSDHLARCTHRDARIISFDLKGKLHGKQQVLYPNLDLKSIAYYKNGVLHGTLGFYYPDRSEELQYKRGKFVKRTERERRKKGV